MARAQTQQVCEKRHWDQECGEKTALQLLPLCLGSSLASSFWVKRSLGGCG